MSAETDPLTRFENLYNGMLNSGVPEPAAVTLATATPEGKPSARVVLLKDYDQRGFVFYTNLGSRKAKELQVNPQAALCFYWEPVHHQVRIEGKCEQVSDEEANHYFSTRPRGSQIGAWASHQSDALQKRFELLKRFLKYQTKFAGRAVPRPDFWSGFRLMPDSIEFWRRQENRLHERELFTREGNKWVITRLYP